MNPCGLRSRTKSLWVSLPIGFPLCFSQLMLLVNFVYLNTLYVLTRKSALSMYQTYHLYDNFKKIMFSLHSLFISVTYILSLISLLVHSKLISNKYNLDYSQLQSPAFNLSIRVLRNSMRFLALYSVKTNENFIFVCIICQLYLLFKVSATNIDF